MCNVRLQLLGLGMLTAGIKLYTKYFNFSSVLVSGAMCTFYLITYFAYGQYHFLSQSLAFGLLTTITASTVVMALRYNRQIIALLGMIGALIILCIGFNLFTDGRFLTPRNIFNLTIQTVSVAIMACGMVFVIVNRHIDLSVGALLATTSAVMAMLQVEILPDILGLGHPMIWIVAVVAA